MERVGKIAFFALLPLGFLYAVLWRRPRVRVIITSPSGNILLVKTWLGRQRWGFPGGGVAIGESFETAAIREVFEETGITLTADSLTPAGNEWTTEGVPMHLYFFKTDIEHEELPSIAKKYQMEIIAREWFSPDNLPEDTSPVVRRHI